MERIMVQGQFRQRVCKTSSQPHSLSMWEVQVGGSQSKFDLRMTRGQPGWTGWGGKAGDPI
jgi:hypothetical protein